MTATHLRQTLFPPRSTIQYNSPRQKKERRRKKQVPRFLPPMPRKPVLVSPSLCDRSSFQKTCCQEGSPCKSLPFSSDQRPGQAVGQDCRRRIKLPLLVPLETFSKSRLLSWLARKGRSLDRMVSALRRSYRYANFSFLGGISEVVPARMPGILSIIFSSSMQ